MGGCSSSSSLYVQSVRESSKQEYAIPYGSSKTHQMKLLDTGNRLEAQCINLATSSGAEKGF